MLDLSTLWDDSDLRTTETRLKIAATEVSVESADYWEIQTQLARTHSLRHQFEKAHRILDQVEQQIGLAPVVQIRYLLERGRAYHAASELDRAQGLFLRAWEIARPVPELAYHAVDAAHMLATLNEDEEALSWYMTAIEHAKRSNDEEVQAWCGPLLNTLAWGYHDLGEFERALTLFQEALTHATDDDEHRNARWCIARTLRSLGEYEKALSLQRDLEATPSKGFVEEEIAELLYLLGRDDEARPYFAAAHQKLAALGWVEPSRLARLKRMAEG